MRCNAMNKQCVCCRHKFKPLPHIPAQRYCSKGKCQRARKNLWKRQKLKYDADYRLNQEVAQKKWRAKCPNYWKNYKTNHPEYVQRNREQCKKRARKIRENNKLKSNFYFIKKFVKSDAFPEINIDKTVSYKLILVPASEFVKIDASLTKTIYLSNG